MYKYKKPLDDYEIKKLQELSQLDFSTMNETDVREEYITPLLTLLGYKKNTDYEVEREETSELVDMSIIIGSKRLKLDYKFNIRKKYFWLIEAKTGKEKEISKENIAQAYLYSLHPDINCRFFAVCNGWSFLLFDRNTWLFKDINADIFTPVLTIKHTELNEDVFNRLYSFLGSSEIVFKIKEDILLKEIQNTLESEIYMDRLKEFSRNVDNIVNKASYSVRQNIWKNNDFKADLEKSRSNFRYLLERQSFVGIVDTVINQLIPLWQIEVAYEVIKEKLLPWKQLTIQYKEGYSCVDTFFNYLFLYPLRAIKIDYIWNVVTLLRFLCIDKDLYGMICNYHGEKVEISQLLNRYLVDIFSFFENRKDIRALIIVYPLYYRIVKYSLYYLANLEIAQKYLVVKNIMCQYLSEEELSKNHYSMGNEVINAAHSMILSIEKGFIDKAFAKQNSLAIKQETYSIGKNINGEVIKRELLNLERSIRNLSQNLDIDKLREQIPSGEEDEMFSFDRDYENPWSTIFLYVLRCCSNISLSQDVLNLIKKLIRDGFISVVEYASFLGEKNVHRDINNKKITENDLLRKYGFTVKDKTIDIINQLKYDWD